MRGVLLIVGTLSLGFLLCLALMGVLSLVAR